MATKIQGITIRLDADTNPLAKAFSDINTKISTTKTELKGIEKGLKLNPDSVILLSQKQEVLSEQDKNTGERLEILKNLEKEVEEQRKNDPTSKDLEQQYRAIQREILATEDSIKKLNAEQKSTTARVKELGSAVDDSGKKHKTFKDKVADVVGKLKDFVKGSKDAKESVKETATEMSSKIEILENFGNAAGNIASKLFDIITNAAQSADEITRLSDVTGLSTDTLQKFQYAAQLVDVEFTTLQDGLKTLTKGMSDAKKGTGEASEGFAALGIKVTDSRRQLRDSEEVFYEVIDALSKVRNTTERDAIAMQIFGESAQNLNPLIKQGSAALKEYGKQAEDAGIIMSEEALSGANELNDKLYALKATIEGVATAAGAQMAEGLTNMLESFAPIIKVLGEFILLLSNIPGEVVVIVGIIASVITLLIKVYNASQSLLGFIDAFNPKAMKTTAIILGIVAAVTALLILIAALSDKKDDINQITNSVGQYRQDAVSYSNGNNSRPPRYANGTEYHRGGVAFITEFTPEQLSLPNGTNMVVMPRGTKVSPNIESYAAGGDNIYVTIDAKNVQEFNDIVRMAKSAKAERRAR